MPPEIVTGLLERTRSSIDVGAEPIDEPRPLLLQASDLNQRAGAWVLKNSRSLIAGGMRLGNAMSIAVAAMAAYKLHQNNIVFSNIYALDVVIAILLCSLYFEYTGLYDVSHSNKLEPHLPKLTVAFGGVAGTLIVLDYLLKTSDQISRSWSASWLLGSLLLLAGVRVAAWRAVAQLDRTGGLATPVAIVGSRDSNRRLLAQLSPQLGKTVNLVGIFDTSDDTRATFDRLARVSRTTQIDEVLVPLPWTGAAPLEALLRPLKDLPMVVKLVPEMPTTSFSCLAFSEHYGLPAISVIKRPLSDFQIAAKRGEDLALAGLALVLLAPLMVLIAALVKLDSPGPALFRQARWGFNAKQISVLKFRTMRVQTDDDPAVTQATRGDPRVTRLGRFLRRTSLDELPQIINVLRGDMSLVGPRPHAVAHNEHYVSLIDGYLGRHRVKPGITGLAQVNGCRGITDTLDKMEERVIYDLRYIDEWSLMLDLRIMLATIFVGFVNKNAF